MLNRRSQISKNTNPYKNYKAAKENKSLRQSIENNPFVYSNCEPRFRERKDVWVVQEELKAKFQIKRKSNSKISDRRKSKEAQPLEDYSKVIEKLQKINVSRDKAVRNQMNQLDPENEFMRNPGMRVCSRKSQCRKQPSQSKMADWDQQIK